MEKKWVKLHSKFLNWEWYQDKNTKVLFIHCLLKANWKDGKFEGIDVPRGSFVTSLNSLSEETGLSKQEARTAIKHLISTQEITQLKYSKYTVITIKNYEQYQEANTLSNTVPTQYQHSINTVLTPIEEIDERNSNIEENTNNNRIVEKEEIYKEEKEKIELFDYDWMDDEHES